MIIITLHNYCICIVFTVAHIFGDITYSHPGVLQVNSITLTIWRWFVSHNNVVVLCGTEVCMCTSICTEGITVTRYIDHGNYMHYGLHKLLQLRHNSQFRDIMVWS